MKKPESDLHAAGSEPSERQRRAARKPGVEEYHIYFLPEGKGGPRERKGSVPLDVDPFDAIEERKDLEPGLYRVEKRKGGEFAKEVCHYTKEHDAVQTDDQSLSDEEDELTRGYASESSTPDDARIAKVVAATVKAVLNVRDQRERAAQGQPDPMDQFRQMRQMLKEEREEMSRQMRELLPRQNLAQNQPEMDAETQATVYFVKQTGALKEMLRATREVITTPERIDEPAGWGNWLKDMARDFLPYIGPAIGPAVGSRLVALLSRIDDATLMQAIGTQPAQQPGQPAQPVPPSQPPPVQVVYPQGAHGSSVPLAQATGSEADDAPLTLDDVLHNIKADLQEGNEPADAIDEVIRLKTEQPHLGAHIDKLLALPNEQLLTTLSEATGAQLALLKGASDYLDALKEGVDKRIKSSPIVVEAGPFEESLSRWLDDALRDCQQGASAAKSADAYIALLTKFAGAEPLKMGNIEALLQQPPAVIAQALSSLSPGLAPIVNTPQAHVWLGQLQGEIAGRKKLAVSEASSNGKGAVSS